MINTLLLVALAYGLRSLRRPAARGGILPLMLAVAALGAYRAALHWNDIKASQAAEAQFMLANPDKMLVSDIRAFWFLKGVAALYPGHGSGRYVSRWEPQHREAFVELLQAAGPLWAYRDGAVREASPALRERLLSTAVGARWGPNDRVRRVPHLTAG